jgi:hypothetical protein
MNVLRLLIRVPRLGYSIAVVGPGESAAFDCRAYHG